MGPTRDEGGAQKGTSCSYCGSSTPAFQESARRRLPDRRECETSELEASGLHYTYTVGRFADGRLAEIFLRTTSKVRRPMPVRATAPWPHPLHCNSGVRSKC